MKSVSAIIAELKDAGASWEVILIAVTAIDEATTELKSEVEMLRAAEAKRRDRIAARKRSERIRIPRPSETRWLALTTAVYARDGKFCSYCGDTNGPFCVDHIHPVSRGGSNDLSNLVVACTSCNCSKGDRLLNEWRRRP